MDLPDTLADDLYDFAFCLSPATSGSLTWQTPSRGERAIASLKTTCCSRSSGRYS